jgi:hypothetical protein
MGVKNNAILANHNLQLKNNPFLQQQLIFKAHQKHYRREVTTLCEKTEALMHYFPNNCDKITPALLKNNLTAMANKIIPKNFFNT